MSKSDHLSDPFYLEANQKYLAEIISDIESGKAHFVEHDLIEECNEETLAAFRMEQSPEEWQPCSKEEFRDLLNEAWNET